jgi:hypothetical protein
MIIGFQIVGVFFLLTTCIFLFSDAAGHSPDEISPAAPLIGKICVIAFVVAWNAMVFFMLRHSSRMLRQIRQERQAEQGGDGDAEEAV